MYRFQEYHNKLANKVAPSDPSFKPVYIQNMMQIKCDIDLFVEKPTDTGKEAILKMEKQVEKHNKRLAANSLKKKIDEKELKQELEKTNTSIKKDKSLNL